jgi:hypothetical protein
MKMTNLKKYESFLLFLSVLSIFLYLPFEQTELRFDIYIFHDYDLNHKYPGRKLDVIIYELCTYLRNIVFTFLLWRRLKHFLFLTVFMICFFEGLFYLLFFGQGTDPYLISISCLFILIYIFKEWRKRNYDLY